MLLGFLRSASGLGAYSRMQGMRDRHTMAIRQWRRLNGNKNTIHKNKKNYQTLRQKLSQIDVYTFSTALSRGLYIISPLCRSSLELSGHIIIII